MSLPQTIDSNRLAAFSPTTNQPPLRIALFTETFLPKIDGVVTILCLMLQRMSELGHQVLLFGPSGGPDEYAGAQIVGVAGPKLFFYPELRMLLPRRDLLQRVRNFQPDVIHAVHPFFLGTYGLWCARSLNVATVASFHTHIPKYLEYYGYDYLARPAWAYSRFLHNRADLSLCTSTAMRSELREQGFQRVRWWKRGIDTDRFSPGSTDWETRSRLTGGKPENFLVVNVGRHAPEKGLHQLRDQLFPQEGVSLALIGDGPSNADLKRHFAGTATTFPGYLKGEELVAAYRAADVFLFPSTTETFGLVALEAMACRVPVIAARTGGVLDTIKDGINGLFFDPEQPQQIGELVQKLRSNPLLRDRLAENALSHARSQSWRATMDQLVDYYRKAMRVHRLSERSA